MEVESGPLDDHFPIQKGGFHVHDYYRKCCCFNTAICWFSLQGTPCMIATQQAWRHTRLRQQVQAESGRSVLSRSAPDGFGARWLMWRGLHLHISDLHRCVWCFCWVPFGDPLEWSKSASVVMINYVEPGDV